MFEPSTYYSIQRHNEKSVQEHGFGPGWQVNASCEWSPKPSFLNRHPTLFAFLHQSQRQIPSLPALPWCLPKSHHCTHLIQLPMIRTFSCALTRSLFSHLISKSATEVLKVNLLIQWLHWHPPTSCFLALHLHRVNPFFLYIYSHFHNNSTSIQFQQLCDIAEKTTITLWRLHCFQK